MTLTTLRPHQVAAVDGIKQSILAGQTRPLLGAPTGFGKTEVAVHLIADARERRKRIAFCVPSIGLVDQTFERFANNGFDPTDMGVMQASHPWRRPHAPIQIATAQTLSRRDLPVVDEVIIDEAHMQFEVYRRWMNDPAWQDKPFIGLTATPGSKGLGKFFTNLVRPITLSELIEKGFLAPMRVYAPSKPDLEGIKLVAGDYHEGELSERMNKPKLVADAVATWQRLGDNRPTLCFAVDRNHAKSLHEAFTAAGVLAAYVDAHTPREERDAIGRQLGAGEVQVVVNIGCLTTGIDWDVRCIILCRPTKSEMLFVQIVGRGLRTAPGKTDCLILDHSDTHARLGMVTDIVFDELDDGSPKKADAKKPKDKGLLPKLCTCCSAMMPAHERKCLVCGTPLRMPSVFTAEGELTPFGQLHFVDGLVAKLKTTGLSMRLADDGKLLVSPRTLITPEIADEIRENRDDLVRHLLPPPPKQSVREQVAKLGEQTVYSMLLTHADDRNFSEGWAAHKYKEIFGRFPRGLAKHGGVMPAPVLRSWIKSQQIRWSYSSKVEASRHAV